jgi:tetratricopeptide (TPR) repeat protein
MRKTKMPLLIVIISVISMIIIPSLNAQRLGKARLKGSLVDDQGKPVKGATIAIKYAGSINRQGQFVPAPADMAPIKYETKSDKKGNWYFTNLGSGVWDVSAKVEGYVPVAKRVPVSQVRVNKPVSLKLSKSIKKAAQEELKKDANLIQEGDQLFKEQKYEEAVAAFQKFLEEQPDFFLVHIKIGDCYNQSGDNEKALAEYTKYLEKAPKDDTTLNLRAHALAQIGGLYIKKEDMETAKKYFIQSIDLNPKDEILAYNVAEIFYGNNKNDDAIKYYGIAAQIKPKWGDPILKMGYVYLNMGDMKKAIETFSKFLEIDPNHAEAATIKDLIKSLKEM